MLASLVVVCHGAVAVEDDVVAKAQGRVDGLHPSPDAPSSTTLGHTLFAGHQGSR